MVSACVECGTECPLAAPGKTRLYCSSTCKLRAKHRRQREAGTEWTMQRVLGTCETCAQPMERTRSAVLQRPSWRCATCRGIGLPKPVTSAERSPRACAECRRPFVPAVHNEARCSDECRAETKRRLARQAYHDAKAAQGDGRTPERYRRAIDRRNRRTKDRWVEDVDLSYIADRDRWRCHLCGKKVPADKRHPHPMSASIDHIIPLVDDGEHSKRNAALAHLRCNLSKHAQAVGEQLRLIG